MFCAATFGGRFHEASPRTGIGIVDAIDSVSGASANRISACDDDEAIVI
jgi:hypothetical protein